jgi:GDPmannose 4,6-dehydratase
VKSALITGISGMDGSLLADFLLKRGYRVYGAYRRLSSQNFWRLQYLDIFDKIKLIPFDLGDMSSIVEAINVSQPDELYHLAANSFVADSFSTPINSGDVTGLGVSRVLEAVRQSDLNIRMYNAASSEMYGNGNDRSVLDENSKFDPISPYACSKLFGFQMAKIYRNGYNLPIYNGILFNHECSPFRGLSFVTRKITNYVAKLHLGLVDKPLLLGNIKAKRDWGYAPEYCKAMWMMLQQDKPDDFVIATNETHSVEELLDSAFSLIGKDWHKHVDIDSRFMRTIELHHLSGNSSKAENTFGWKAEVKFDKLVSLMFNEDLKCWQRWMSGDRFAWDALSHLEGSNIITRTVSE